MLIDYLSWPRLQRMLGGYYLPIALISTVVLSLTAQNLFLTAPVSMTGGGNEECAWQLFLFLFVPLTLLSWQYDFKAVVAYCLFMTVLDFALARFTNPDYAAVHA